MRRARLKLLSASASHPKFKNYPLPQPFQHIRLRGDATGDDCSMAASHFVAVADGVGQWNRRKHGSAGLWSRLMITFFAERVEALAQPALSTAQATAPEHLTGAQEGRRIVDILEEAYHAIMALCKDPASTPTAPSPKGDFTTTSMSDPMNKGERILKDDGAEVEYQGSTTLLVGYLPPDAHALHVVNIGDSSLLHIRDGTVLFETEPQSHWFDCPYQIGHNSPDTPAKSAALVSLEIQEGDLFVTSTDGLGDNVYPAQILGVIGEEQASSLDDPPEKQQDDLNRISSRLVTMAREKMADEWGESPFGDKAICEGIGFMGGKKDDVSILVTKVIRA